ncbi:MAG: malto-oligosyltrehalose trehalohydrolase [Aureliella sp.]
MKPVAMELSKRAFRVWAPSAKKVEVQLQSGSVTLMHNASGWWTGELPFGEEDRDYSLRIDGGPPRPDPRSPWQPQGVHGPSRWVDHSEFQWHDGGFQARPLSSSIIYELHIGTFTSEGTFDGAISQLDHLVRLGVTHVELMPVAEFPGKFGWGYDGVCLFAPRELYGGPAGLKRFVDACHRHGLGVILDVVYNHLGPSGNYLSEFGPYFTERHRTPWGPAINFDGPQSDGVRRFFCDNACMWLRDYHIDALRLDAVHAIIDTTATPFLEQLAAEVQQLAAHTGRHLAVITESDLNDPRIVRAVEAGGYGIDAQWCDDFHHALHTALSGERSGYYVDFGTIETLAKAFEQPFVYAGEHSPFRERRHGRPAVGLSAHRFITYTQNHDQIGNRARGERLGHLIGHKRAKIAAALVLAGPYIPQLFQGEEWASKAPFLFFADWSQKPELAKAVVEGRQEEFGAFGWKPEDLFDPNARETFELSKLDWHALGSEPHASMFAWYQELIALRREIPDLTDGRLDMVRSRYDEQAQWLLVQRGSILIVANLSEEPCEIGLEEPGPWRVLLASEPVDPPQQQSIRLAAESVAILGH